MPLIVNGEEIAESAVAQEAESLLTRFRQLSEQERSQNGFNEETMQARAQEWARENLIERTLMRQEAFKDPEPIAGDVLEKALESMYKRFGGKEKFEASGLGEPFIKREAEITVKLDRLLSRITKSVKTPATKESAAFYRKNQERWQIGETLRAAHIVKHVNESVSVDDARKAIEDAKAQLDQGVEFEKLADESSDCPGSGGDLGWFPRGQMVQEFEDVVFAMEPGQVSKPFQSVFGFHIAKVYERRPATVKPFNEVKAEIEKQLKREAETKAVEDFVDRIREEAEIENTPPVEAAKV